MAIEFAPRWADGQGTMLKPSAPLSNAERQRRFRERHRGRTVPILGQSKPPSGLWGPALPVAPRLPKRQPTVASGPDSIAA